MKIVLIDRHLGAVMEMFKTATRTHVGRGKVDVEADQAVQKSEAEFGGILAFDGPVFAVA